MYTSKSAPKSKTASGSAVSRRPAASSTSTSRTSGANTKISTARYDAIPRSGGIGSKTAGRTFLLQNFSVILLFL